MIAVSRAMIGQIGLVIGALLILVSAIGVVRLPDVLSRMHGLSKASTAGVGIALFSAAFGMSRLDDAMSLVFAAALQVLTNPVASTLLTRATHHAEEDRRAKEERESAARETAARAPGQSAQRDG